MVGPKLETKKYIDTSSSGLDPPPTRWLLGLVITLHLFHMLSASQTQERLPGWKPTLTLTKLSWQFFYYPFEGCFNKILD